MKKQVREKGITQFTTRKHKVLSKIIHINPATLGDPHDGRDDRWTSKEMTRVPKGQTFSISVTF